MEDLIKGPISYRVEFGYLVIKEGMELMIIIRKWQHYE